MHYLAQSLPLSEATADKLLGANFLSLALIALVMVVAMFLLFVWMNARREAAEARRQDAYDKRQDAFLKTVIGDDSPLVKAQRAVTDILEKSEKRAEERTSALQVLVQKTDVTNELSRQSITAIDNQTKVIEVQNLDHNNYQTLVTDTLSAVNTRVDGLETSVNTNTENIAALTEQIKALVAKLDDKAACADAEERMRKFRDEIKALLTEQQAKKTDTLPAVNVIPDTDAGGSAVGEAA